MLTENEGFFQSSIDKWIGDRKERFKEAAKFKLAVVYCCRKNYFRNANSWNKVVEKNLRKNNSKDVLHHW